MGPAHRSRFRSRAAVIVTLATLPILWTPNVVVARKVVGGFRVAIPGALLFAADGWIATGYVFVWQIALTFITAPRYAKASFAFQNSVIASLRPVRFPSSMWER
jgi:DHA1 family inner membrane transport protein